MRLWEILKMINENKISEGTLFRATDILIDLVLEYKDGFLIYNSIMGDKLKKPATLCDGEIEANYEMQAPKLCTLICRCGKKYDYIPSKCESCETIFVD